MLQVLTVWEIEKRLCINMRPWHCYVNWLKTISLTSFFTKNMRPRSKQINKIANNWITVKHFFNLIANVNGPDWAVGHVPFSEICHEFVSRVPDSWLVFFCFLFFFYFSNVFLLLNGKSCVIYCKKYLISSGDLQGSCHFDPPSKCLHSYYSLEIQNESFCSVFFPTQLAQRIEISTIEMWRTVQTSQKKKRNTSISVYSFGSCFFFCCQYFAFHSVDRFSCMPAMSTIGWSFFFLFQCIEISLNNI